MPGLLEAPPVLSTSDTNIFEDRAPSAAAPDHHLSDEEILVTYEIQRTLTEIKHGGWRRIALQFPDEMLRDAPRVVEALRTDLNDLQPVQDDSNIDESFVTATQNLHIDDKPSPEKKLYILADTSYGACCVDEIAAEHVDADVVVHYGRACLSPTARLPVIHVFTHQPLDLENVVGAFESLYPDSNEKIILMADVTYTSHLPELDGALRDRGYVNLYTPSILHDPSSPLPNRTVPANIRENTSLLKEWQLFHVSEPPQSLLLTLSSRLSSIHIYPTFSKSSLKEPQSTLASTALSLRRRYAVLTSLSTISIFGILINTLSVKNYLHMVEHVKAQILGAGKKSYTFVVGKVNAAKIANFSEVGGWVVIGCWESSLVDSKDFWKPVITPFELELALRGDADRIWTGEWRSDFQGILDNPTSEDIDPSVDHAGRENDGEEQPVSALKTDDVDSEPESAPPEFDLRTGRYISHSRPMRNVETPVAERSLRSSHDTSTVPANSLTRRPKGDLTVMGSGYSPAADFLQSKRTWKGLGSDLELAYDESGSEAATIVEQGRSGIARGYRTGGETIKR